MKTKYLYMPLCLLVMLSITGCSKNWLEVNEDLNNITETNISADLVLPQALLSSATILTNDLEFLERWMGYWCVPAGMFANPLEQSYEWHHAMSDQLYNNLMANNANYERIIVKWGTSEMDLYVGISRLMKAHNFSILTDVFNNIPYSQALKGAQVMTPAYDPAKEICEDLINSIELAITEIKRAETGRNPGIVTADIVFHGDKIKWLRFANTLKLRLLMHQANLPGRAVYITEELAKMNVTSTTFLGSGQNAAVNPGFSGEPGKQNPYYERYGFDAMGNPTFFSMMARANNTALSYLKEHKDPRISYFYRPTEVLPSGQAEPVPTTAPFEFRGNIYGQQVDQQQYLFQGPFHTSAIGGRSTHGPVSPSASGIIKGYNMDLWLMTSVESLFLQAEAAAHGWINGDPEAMYKAALLESFLWLNVEGSVSAATASFEQWYAMHVQQANPKVAWRAATDKLKLLAFQKYMALNGTSPLESWTDYRRNGKFPDIPLSAAPGRGNHPLPVRLPYPQVEYNFNADNVKAQGAIDHFTSKIWWMP